MSRTVRRLRRVGLFILLPLVLLTLGTVYYILPVGSAFAAKTMCSCVFVAGTSEEKVREVELATLSPFDVEVDYENKRTIGSFKGLRKKVVVYREGLGCTIVSDTEPDVLQAQVPAAPQAYLAQDTLTYWPMGDVDTLAMPEGIDQDALGKVVEEHFTENHPEGKKNARALLVIHDGKIVAERYAEGFNDKSLMRGWSMAKSVTNAFIGILVKQGKMDIYDPAPVPEWQEEGDPRKAITTDMLLRMSSGLDFLEFYAFRTDATEMLFLRGDAGGYAAQSELGAPPDTEFGYSSGTSNILSRIVRHQFEDHQDYLNFPYKELFGPLGMDHVIMEPDASGTFVGSSFLWMTARDWARFGMLYLNEGKWEGQQILPEGWATYSGTRTKTSDAGVYAAQFWTPAAKQTGGWYDSFYWPGVPQDTYLAEGFEGQAVVIIPSRNTVIVRLGVTHNRSTWSMGDLVADILKALPDDL